MSSESKPNVQRPAETPTASPWFKGNLMGLGSAAVLAVYAAGFERTRAAAERFNAAETSRRSAVPVQTTGEVHAPSPRVPEAPPSVATKATPVAAPKARARASEPVATPAPSEKRAAEPTPIVAAPVEPPARDSVPATVPTPAPAPAPTPAPVKPVDTPAAPKPAPAAADTTRPEKAPRQDGTYSGWGTSRHGDIQATIQIKNGKIVFAAISECLTRYPCSWIAALPSQVLARQSADVDFVSGATESANAFYSAVVEALNKAK